MKFKSRKQGIVLITTMLSVVLVVMLLSAVVYSNMGSLRLTSNFYDRETALMAADSGMQYAVTKLQNDITWRGVDKYSLTFSKTKGLLQVEEENGNVIGIVNLSNGRRAAFRIKFNCEDGAGGLDDMADSRQPMDLVNVSTNNLYSTSESEAYIAGKDGKVAVKNGKAEEIEVKGSDGHSLCTYPFDIPKQTCRLVVQGLAGSAIRDAAPADLHRLDSLKGNITPVCVECYAAVDNDALNNNALACAAADIKINGSSSLFIKKIDSAETAKIGSLGNINITHGDKFTFDGKAYTGSGKEYTLNGVRQNSDNYNKDDITALAWSDIPKAERSGNTLQSGTYVWDTVNGKNVLKYYNANFTDIKDIPGDITPTEIKELKGVTLNSNNMSMVFNTNTYVSGSFNVLTADEGKRPIVGFAYQQDNKPNILTTAANGVDKGSVYIQGTTLGQGSITAEGDITIQGTSIMESNPTMGVSIYSQGDIQITQIQGTTQAAEESKTEANSSSNSHDISVNETDRQTAYRDIIQANPKSPREIEKRIDDLEDSFEEQIEIYMQKNNIQNINVEIGNYREHYHTSLSDCISKVLSTYLKMRVEYDGDPRRFEAPEAPYHHPDEYLEAQMLVLVYNRAISTDVKNAIKPVIQNSYKEVGNNGNVNFFNLDLGKKANIDAKKIIENPIFKNMFGDIDAAQKTQQLTNLALKYDGLTYNDLDITGVIYACGNISIDTGDHVLNLTGNMVAYGGDPENDDPGANSKGTINLSASKVGLTYDPTYLNNLLALSKRRQLKKGLYCTY